MGGGTFSTLHPPSDISDTPAVVAADTLMKLRREMENFLMFVIWLILSKGSNNQSDLLKKVVSFVIDDDEGREILYPDLTDGFHAQLFKIYQFD